MARKGARRSMFGAVGALAALLLILSACGGAAEGGDVASAGGDASPTADETEEREPLDADAQALIFADCVRDNGVDMPDPGPGQQGLIDAFRAVAEAYDRATLERALTACEDLVPQYPGQQHDPGDDEWMLALAECLREQGLDVSDNPFDDAHAGRIDVNEFAAAMEVCRQELAGAGS